MRRQGEVLARLLSSPNHVGLILDCACGIGTQAISLAAQGYQVEGSDVSARAVKRAEQEASTRGLCVAFRVDDMRILKGAMFGAYGAVFAMDNALPHLESDEEILAALKAMHSRLRKGGTLLLSLRDYGRLMVERPSSMPPSFYEDAGLRRIVHQVWDWQDDRHYRLHLYVTREVVSGSWDCHHTTGMYRAVTLNEVVELARRVGFSDVRTLESYLTGYYQPIISATKKF